LHGTGFGECVLALVEADWADAVLAAVADAYAAAGYQAPVGFVAAAVDGAHRR
jgi:galactokinase